MTASPVIPDASVILKWVVPTDDEPDRDQALAVRDAIVEERVRALLPSLWLFEVANTLGRKIPESASKLTRLLVDLSIPELTPDTRWLETALELMKSCNVAFHDASYHATAICTGGVFITADGRYERRVRERGHIVLLDSWRLVDAWPAASAHVPLPTRSDRRCRGAHRSDRARRPRSESRS